MQEGRKKNQNVQSVASKRRAENPTAADKCWQQERSDSNRPSGVNIRPLYVLFDFSFVDRLSQNRGMSLNATDALACSPVCVPQKRTSHLPIQPDISCAIDTITRESLSIREISSNLSMLLLSSPCGAMVQRLARGPFNAISTLGWVRTVETHSQNKVLTQNG